MDCCANCFKEHHEYLAQSIAGQGTLGDCDYCGSTSVHCLPAEALRSAFEPILALFEPADRSALTQGHFPLEGPLHEVVDGCYQLWSRKLPRAQQEVLFADIAGPKYIGSGEVWLCTIYERQVDHWPAFCDHIRHSRRFIPDDEDDRIAAFRQMLPLALTETATDRPEGGPYYRARRGGVDLEYMPFPYRAEDMGAPPPGSSRAGRANSSGIPCLYVATDEPTAVAEVRPWKSAHVTVAELVLTRSVQLVEMNSTPDEWSPFGKQDLPEYIAHRRLLYHIGLSLAEPVEPMPSESDYLPTQYVAEAVRDAGYDGMVYPSAMGPGVNLVFFDPTVAKVTTTKLLWVYDVGYEYCDVT